MQHTQGKVQKNIPFNDFNMMKLSNRTLAMEIFMVGVAVIPLLIAT